MHGECCVGLHCRLHGRGAWSTEGVETVSDKWSTQVVCHGSGFGPLTVLTDIQGPVSATEIVENSILYKSTVIPHSVGSCSVLEVICMFVKLISYINL